MKTSTKKSDALDIKISDIQKNPENPRIFFRDDELEKLLSSIAENGVLVPIYVYEEGKKFVLIDGERRWRCSKKLNIKTIPALVQEKPTELENLILMFNIHAVREEWDLLTIAIKLPSIIELLRVKYKKEPNEADIARETGLSRSVIRRSKDLNAIPKKYIDLVLTELEKPKKDQKIREDFLIEMERALKRVQTTIPSLINGEDEKNVVRDNLISKYQHNVIKNVTALRKIPQIIKLYENDKNSAKKLIKKALYDKKASLDEIHETATIEKRQEINLETSLKNIKNSLLKISTEQASQPKIKRALINIRHIINKLISFKE